MTQADRVLSTPPTNTSKSRRAVLAGIASAAALPIAAAVPTIAEATTDPIFAAIDAFRRANAAVVAVDGDIPDELGDQCHEAYLAVVRTHPITPAGLAALTTWVRERTDWLRANSTYLPGEELCAIAASIDDATRGMTGLKPWSPPLPAAAAQAIDAELIELGARFERLVDRYYVAHRCWSGSLAKAHAEHDREFGDPADRDYEYPPEIRKAFEDSCERSGVRAADDELSAIREEMRPLENAINASSVTSIEGLRAKALVAFREVSPLSAGSSEFSFDDAYPFQQLFTAVAEFCGLKDKMAATGYELPDIAMVDDETDDEGEEA